MPLVVVKKQFKLLQDDGIEVDFFPGPQHITDEHAAHWYVKLFLKGDEDKPPVPGTPEYGAYLREQHIKHLQASNADAEILAAAQAETQRLKEQEAITQANRNIRADSKQAIKREKILKRA